MNTLKKNSQGFGYKYTDLAEIHRHMEEVGLRYYQELESIDGEDYVVTHILDSTDKIIRTCRGCRVVKVSGKNPAQDYGSALTYARRYSLLLAFGLATADDDAAALNPVPPKSATPKRKSMDIPKATPKVTKSTEKPYRQAGINAVKHLLDTGDLQLADIHREVRKYGYERMQELPHDAFIKCVASLTQGRGASV